MHIRELKSEDEITGYLRELEQERRHVIALDIEAEFNLHCYGEHLCLIQIFDLQNEIIIDPFRFKDSAPLKALFEKRDLLKILYDAASDSCLLANVCGIRINSVLDLRPAVSLLEYEGQSLAHVLQEELGIVSPSKKRFQRYNWMKRPVEPAAIEYAMNDVRFLFTLKEALFARLSSRGLFDTYLLHNLMLQDGNGHKNKKEKYEKAKGYNRLKKPQQNLFRALFAARDAFARRLNKPPHYVFSNANLLDLCQAENHNTAFIQQGIHPGIKPSLRDELVAQFSSLIQA